MITVGTTAINPSTSAAWVFASTAALVAGLSSNAGSAAPVFTSVSTVDSVCTIGGGVPSSTKWAGPSNTPISATSLTGVAARASTAFPLSPNPYIPLHLQLSAELYGPSMTPSASWGGAAYSPSTFAAITTIGTMDCMTGAAPSTSKWAGVPDTRVSTSALVSSIAHTVTVFPLSPIPNVRAYAQLDAPVYGPILPQAGGLGTLNAQISTFTAFDLPRATSTNYSFWS